MPADCKLVLPLYKKEVASGQLAHAASVQEAMELERVASEEEDDEADDDLDHAELKGWPLGLLATTATKLAEAGSASSMVLPSCTSSSESSSSSSSSSEFDTESLGSFFPENSTSLGTLIGIHSSSQLSFVHDLSLEERQAGKRTGRHRRLCSLIGCGANIQEDATEEEEEAKDSMDESPSVSRYWSMDRREFTRSAPSSMRADVAEQQREIEDNIGVNEQAKVRAHEKSWLRSFSRGRSIRIALPKPGFVSPWRAFWDKAHHSSTRNNRVSRVSNRSSFFSFWMGLCSKLGSRLDVWSF